MEDTPMPEAPALVPVARDAFDRVNRLALSPAEAATALGLCRASIYNMLARGEIRSVKFGRARRIPLSEIERLCGDGGPDAPAA